MAVTVRGVPVQLLTGLVAVAAALAVATAVGLLHRTRDGRLRQVHGTADVTDTLAELGVIRGTPATLVQFSTASCAPCRVARKVCVEAAAGLDGVVHLEVDAAVHLGAVRALDVWRVPTILVVDGTGRVVQRATGTPTLAQVLTAVQPLARLEVSS